VTRARREVEVRCIADTDQLFLGGAAFGPAVGWQDERYTSSVLDWCESACSGHAYMAIQAATSCFCGHEVKTTMIYSPLAPSLCDARMDNSRHAGRDLCPTDYGCGGPKEPRHRPTEVIGRFANSVYSLRAVPRLEITRGAVFDGELLGTYDAGPQLLGANGEETWWTRIADTPSGMGTCASRCTGYRYMQIRPHLEEGCSFEQPCARCWCGDAIRENAPPTFAYPRYGEPLFSVLFKLDHPQERSEIAVLGRGKCEKPDRYGGKRMEPLSEEVEAESAGACAAACGGMGVACAGFAFGAKCEDVTGSLCIRPVPSCVVYLEFPLLPPSNDPTYAGGDKMSMYQTVDRSWTCMVRSFTAAAMLSQFMAWPTNYFDPLRHYFSSQGKFYNAAHEAIARSQTTDIDSAEGRWRDLSWRKIWRVMRSFCDSGKLCGGGMVSKHEDDDHCRYELIWPKTYEWFEREDGPKKYGWRSGVQCALEYKLAERGIRHYQGHYTNCNVKYIPPLADFNQGNNHYDHAKRIMDAVGMTRAQVEDLTFLGPVTGTGANTALIGATEETFVGHNCAPLTRELLSCNSWCQLVGKPGGEIKGTKPACYVQCENHCAASHCIGVREGTMYEEDLECTTGQKICCCN